MVWYGIELRDTAQHTFPFITASAVALLRTSGLRGY